MMKKSITLLASLLLLMSSCGSYEASGAYTGATFGSMIGSAVGGLAGGWRGSYWGELAGMAGGAVVGAAIGKAADNQANQRYEASRRYDEASRSRDAYGQADDRIIMEPEGNTTGRHMVGPAPQLEIRHVRLFDQSEDGVLSRGEEARVVFELFNASSQPAYRVLPMVSETTGNKHIHISENVYVECIQPNQGIRYTAMVKADKGLKDGEALIRVGVQQGGMILRSQTHDLTLRTSKR